MASGTLEPQLLTSLDQNAPEPSGTSAAKHTYGEILKSSALVGGSSVVNLGIRIVRNKAVALMLGPAGFGLAGLYGSIEDMTVTVAGMGVNSSGVRQIAEAVGSGDTERIARTTTVLRRTSLLLGALGGALLIAFSRHLSTLTFGTPRHSVAICLLALSVFFRLVSSGQGALIQGTRRIGDLAKMGVTGAICGTVISILVIYVLRLKGVVPSLVVVSCIATIASWWYSRKVRIQSRSLTISQVVQEVSPLLKLGFVFMASGFMVTGMAYVIRILVLHRAGFEATGFYQAAWTLGGLYVGFILQAMGADFYPRLTASANDNPVCNRLVNEQVGVALLLACPGVIATLTCAPAVIQLFYTAKFAAATVVLRWICLGTTLQAVTWPMGFIIVAKGRRGIYFCAELACAAAYAGLAWICVERFGLEGAGIAFFLYCIFHGFLHYPIARSLSGFRWSASNKRTALLFLSLVGPVFCSSYVLPFRLFVCLGVLATIASGILSARCLLSLAWNEIPGPLRQLAARLGLSPSRVATAG